MKTIKFTYLVVVASLGLFLTVGCASNDSHQRNSKKCSYKKEQCPRNCDKPCCAKKEKKQCSPDCQKPCCKKK